MNFIINSLHYLQDGGLNYKIIIRMYQLEVISHSCLTPTVLDIIIDIKSKSWDYTYKEQKSWIDKNIHNKDLHLLLKKNNNYVAYMNLIDISVLVNDIIEKMYGVGNVCAIEKRLGYGSELMKLSNQYILRNNNPSILFCKKELIDFYSNFNWRLLKQDMVFSPFCNNDIFTMVFNYSSEIYTLQYDGKAF